MAFTRRIYAGAAVVTTVTVGISSTATAVTVDDSTGWPSGGEFAVVVDPDTTSEEKFLANGRTGNTITLATSSDRGIDGTSAQSHEAGAKIYPTLTAGDLDEANYTVTQTVGKITAKGALLAGTSNAALAQLPAGTNTQLLQVDTSTTTGLTWGALPDGSITTSGKFAAGVVNTAALADDAVTTAKIGDDQITTALIADDQITNPLIAADAVTGAEIADASIAIEHFASGLRPLQVATTAPSSPVEGDSWFESDDNELHLYNGSAWMGAGAFMAPAPQTFAFGLSDGTATSYTAITTENSILTAPYPLTMLVQVGGYAGFSGLANTTNFRITDQAGTNISVKASGNDYTFGGEIGKFDALTLLGRQEYAAGATCGFRFQYKVDVSNVYGDFYAIVTFIPKVA